MRRMILGIALAVSTACAGENDTVLPEDYVGEPDPTPACVPDLDGSITAAEMQPALGLPVRLLASPDGEERTVDLAGVTSGGAWAWDWSARVPSDQAATVEATALAGKWFAASFPDGDFVGRVDLAGTIEAVYSHDADALWMHGIASSEADPDGGRTLVVYDEPIALYRFPLAPGASWTSVGIAASGSEITGIPWAGYDTYEVEVDAMGTLALPDLAFTQAHRVRTTVTVQPAFGYPTTRRMASWTFECFGEVARATSRLNETEDDFTTATEVRRLGLLPPE